MGSGTTDIEWTKECLCRKVEYMYVSAVPSH